MAYLWLNMIKCVKRLLCDKHLFAYVAMILLILHAIGGNKIAELIFTKSAQTTSVNHSIRDVDPAAVDTHVNTPPIPLYGDFCDLKVLGEKQLWNTKKKIISFSLFHHTDKTMDSAFRNRYLMGVHVNARLLKLYYPGWILRVHTSGLSDSDIETFIDPHGLHTDVIEVVKCNKKPFMLEKHSRAIQRFLAIDDPTVDVVIVRDLDSRFTTREVMATNEWLGSPLQFHSMRDHQQHNVPIMGGMFGMKKGYSEGSNKTITSLVQNFVKDKKEKESFCGVGEDQCFLREYVWPLVKNVTMSHDIDLERCKMHGSKECLLFPTGVNKERNEYFVGSNFNGLDFVKEEEVLFSQGKFNISEITNDKTLIEKNS